MGTTIIVLIIIAIGLLLAYLRLSRPLTPYEMTSLATIRRNKAIRSYYSFDCRKYTSDTDFKKKMKPSGQIYTVNDSLWEFPSSAASLLKGKKHEWLIIGFEKNKQVNKMWANKGPDNSSVSVFFSPEQLVDFAKQDNYQSVLIFHNHPNSNPGRYDCSMASNQDKITANQYANVLNATGINLLEFVCERGQHHEYFLAAPNSFMPIETYLKDIQKNNGISRGKNIDLQIEMMMGAQWKQTNQIATGIHDNKNIPSETTQIPVAQIFAVIFAGCLLFFPKALLFIVPALLVWLAGRNN